MPKNIDPRHNPKTTISGGLFMLLGISLFLCPYFSYVHEAIKWTLSVVVFGKMPFPNNPDRMTCSEWVWYRITGERVNYMMPEDIYNRIVSTQIPIIV